MKQQPLIPPVGVETGIFEESNLPGHIISFKTVQNF